MIHLNKNQYKDFFDGIRAKKIRKKEVTIPLRQAVKLRKNKVILSLLE